MPASKPVIAVTRRFPEAVEARISEHFSPIFNEDDGPLATAGLIALARDADGLLLSPTERLDADAISRLPERIKIAATYSVGFDHIDVAAARARGLIVTNTPDVLTDATADVAMLLILGAMRRAQEWREMMFAGEWKRWNPRQMLGRDLGGARLGFIGMGRIAQATLIRARAFGCHLQYWNRRRRDDAGLGDDVDFIADLDDLFRRSDIISIHVPGGPETLNLVNRERLALMPRGGVVVNTARGSVVNDDALIEALESGQLLGAGLDVLANEPNFDPRYRSVPNVFILPHIGSATIGTRDGMGFRAIDNLVAYFAGREPPDLVT